MKGYGYDLKICYLYHWFLWSKSTFQPSDDSYVTEAIFVTKYFFVGQGGDIYGGPGSKGIMFLSTFVPEISSITQQD